ncbi:MAG: PKD domain-containing protein [Gemmatimonadota bacterium]
MRHFLSASLLLLPVACDTNIPPTATSPPQQSLTQINAAVAGFTTLTTNIDHTCILDQSGRAFCAGYSGRGAIGYGGQGGFIVDPYPVAGSNVFSTITAGSLHTCALTPTGQAYCWGSNEMGELGAVTATRCLYASVPCAFVPVPVVGGLTFAQIDGGNQFTCALDPAGRAYCWGDNRFGQLGDGTTTRRTTPVLVTGGLTFVSIRAGGFHACALTAAGDIYCWGYNKQGQLGALSSDQCVYFQSYPCSTTPIRVGNARRYMALDAGTLHSCALDSSGKAYCWGSNSHGQLGDAGLNNQPVPTPVASTLTFNRIAGGAESSCSIDASGNGYCWGQSYGRAPVLISGGFNWQSLLPHDDHRCGLALDGSPFCWGLEQYGELGNGGHHQEQFLSPQLMAPPHVVDRPPVAKIIITGCINLGCTFNGVYSTDDFGITSWTWNFGDGTTGSGAIVNHNFPRSGTYTVTLTVSDASQQSNSAVTSVQVYYQPPTNQPPVAAFTFRCAARVPAPGFDCTLDGSSSSDADGSVVSWTWTSPGQPTQSGAITTYTFPTPGTYSVTLTVTDNNGATNSTTQTVVVSAAPPNQVPVASFSYNCVVRPDNIGADCSFDGASSTDPDGTIVSYGWSAPNRPNRTGLTTTYPFRAGSTQTVTLVVTDNKGATNAKSMTFIVR